MDEYAVRAGAARLGTKPTHKETNVAHIVRIATIGPRPMQIDTDTDPSTIVDNMIGFWKQKFEHVLPDKPDLIVVPEACDRPENMPIDKRIAYYRTRGDAIRDYFSQTAAENNCFVVYSAARELPDGTWRNCSELMDRRGETVGRYNKNHVVIEETTQGGILPGSEAPVFDTEVGRIACAICFDLNFDELRLKYAAAKPNLILFSSMYHGGLMQDYWAYSCRSYFVGAIAGPPSQIRNPHGEICAATTNYQAYIVSDVNLDYCVAHLDYNRPRLVELKRAYGPDVQIYDPGFVGSVLITSNSAETSAVDMAKEFEIELLDDYFERALRHHHENRA